MNDRPSCLYLVVPGPPTLVGLPQDQPAQRADPAPQVSVHANVPPAWHHGLGAPLMPPGWTNPRTPPVTSLLPVGPTPCAGTGVLLSPDGRVELDTRSGALWIDGQQLAEGEMIARERAVLQLLMTSRDPVSAKQIHKQIEKTEQTPVISQRTAATVIRALRNCGIRIDTTSEGPASYCLARPAATDPAAPHSLAAGPSGVLGQKRKRPDEPPPALRPGTPLQPGLVRVNGQPAVLLHSQPGENGTLLVTVQTPAPNSELARLSTSTASSSASSQVQYTIACPPAVIEAGSGSSTGLLISPDGNVELNVPSGTVQIERKPPIVLPTPEAGSGRTGKLHRIADAVFQLLQAKADDPQPLSLTDIEKHLEDLKLEPAPGATIRAISKLRTTYGINIDTVQTRPLLYRLLDNAPLSPTLQEAPTAQPPVQTGTAGVVGHKRKQPPPPT